MKQAEARYALIPGAGSAGLTWSAVASALDGLVLPVGDQPEVAAMADALLPQIAALPRLRVIAGASLGAMVALELARRLPVDALVLIATGWGITVSDAVLEWVRSNPPDLLAKLARVGLAEPGDAAAVSVRERDFRTRGGQPSLLGHLRALASYRPEPLDDPPPALVLWGEHDRGVPLADHVELARALGGALVPIAGAGHVPFLERPQETVRWIRVAPALARRGCSLS